MSIDVNNEFLEFVAQSSVNNNVVIKKKVNGNQVSELSNGFKPTVLRPLVEDIGESNLDNEYYLNLKDDELMYNDIQKDVDVIDMMKYCELFLRPFCLPPVDFESMIETMTESTERVVGICNESKIIPREDKLFMNSNKVSREDNGEELPKTNDFLIGTAFENSMKKDFKIKYISDDKKCMILKRIENMGTTYIYFERNEVYVREIIKRPSYTRDFIRYKRKRITDDIIIDKEKKANGDVSISTSDPYFIRLCEDKFNTNSKQVFLKAVNEHMEKIGLEYPNRYIGRNNHKRKYMNINMEHFKDNKRLRIRRYIYSDNNNPSSYNMPRISLVMLPFWMKYFIIKGGEIHEL